MKHLMPLILLSALFVSGCSEPAAPPPDPADTVTELNAQLERQQQKNDELNRALAERDERIDALEQQQEQLERKLREAGGRIRVLADQLVESRKPQPVLEEPAAPAAIATELTVTPVRPSEHDVVIIEEIDEPARILNPELPTDAITERTEPDTPFALLNHEYLGRRLLNGVYDNTGRFTVENLTDSPLEIVAGAGIITERFTLPPQSRTVIHIRARQGAEVTVTGNGHRESFTW